jgi:hypothetical protein
VLDISESCLQEGSGSIFVAYADEDSSITARKNAVIGFSTIDDTCTEEGVVYAKELPYSDCFSGRVPLSCLVDCNMFATEMFCKAADGPP